jgi:hypothetical protein
VVIPWVRAKTGEKRWGQLTGFALVAVRAAEQMANAGLLENSGATKLGYALAQVKEALAKHGVDYSVETIHAAIEAAVLELKKNMRGG